MTIEMNTQKARGRPKISDDLLKDKIFKSSIKILFLYGYSKMTIDAIAKDAGVAKKTIYRFLENREEIVEHLVLSWTNDFVPLFEKHASTKDELIKQLEFNLSVIAQKVLSVEAVGLYKLLQTQFDDRDILLEKYQSCGIERSRAMLTAWLDDHQKKGIITLPCVITFSDLLLSMAIAEPLRQISLGISDAAPASYLDDRIKEISKLCMMVFNH